MSIGQYSNTRPMCAIRNDHKNTCDESCRWKHVRGTLVEPMLKTCVLKQYLLKDCWDLKRKLWWLKTSYHVKALVLEEELAPNEESMIPFRCTPSFEGYLKTWTLSPIALGNIVIRTIVRTRRCYCWCLRVCW